MNTIRLFRGIGMSLMTLCLLALLFGFVLALRAAQAVYDVIEMGAAVLPECWRPNARL